MGSGSSLVLRDKMSFLDRKILFAYSCVFCCAAERFVLYLLFLTAIKLQAIKHPLIDTFSALLPEVLFLISSAWYLIFQGNIVQN